jgi:glucose/arabinose dehydrogenase
MLFQSTCLLLAALGTAAAQPPARLPAPYHTPSASNAPTVIKRPDGAQLTLPAGFTIEEFASGFEKPRYMIQGPSGEILLSDSVKNGRVYRLAGGARKELLSGLDRPYGLALWKDYLYVAEATSVKRYKYESKAQTIGAGEEIIPLKDASDGHWTRTILFDPKGEKLYLSVGSHHNVTPGGAEYRAAILRFNPDGSGREAVATGVRNAIGMDWAPGTKTLWAAVQERDGLGDDLVPDFFTAIKEGGFYGWPYAYIGPNEEPRNKGQRPDLVAKTIVPDVLLPSHVAVMDSRFYTATAFPAKYRGGAFLAYRGSSNRASRVGYSVVFVPFKNGKPSGPVENFLTGFMTDPKSKDVWGRPVGLLVMNDGSMLLSEDGGNKLWRISYKN